MGSKTDFFKMMQGKAPQKAAEVPGARTPLVGPDEPSSKIKPRTNQDTVVAPPDESTLQKSRRTAENDLPTVVSQSPTTNSIGAEETESTSPSVILLETTAPKKEVTQQLDTRDILEEEIIESSENAVPSVGELLIQIRALTQRINELENTQERTDQTFDDYDRDLAEVSKKLSSMEQNSNVVMDLSRTIPRAHFTDIQRQHMEKMLSSEVYKTVGMSPIAGEEEKQPFKQWLGKILDSEDFQQKAGKSTIRELALKLGRIFTTNFLTMYVETFRKVLTEVLKQMGEHEERLRKLESKR